MNSQFSASDLNKVQVLMMKGDVRQAAFQKQRYSLTLKGAMKQASEKSKLAQRVLVFQEREKWKDASSHHHKTASKREFDVEKKKLGKGDTGGKVPELIPGQSGIFKTEELANPAKYCRFKVKRDLSPHNEILKNDSGKEIEFRDYRKLGMLDKLKRPSRGIPIEEESSTDSGKSGREAIATD